MRGSRARRASAVIAVCMAVATLAGMSAARADYTVDDAAVRRAMTDELARAKDGLRIGDEPRPYYVAYTITDAEEAELSASFGAALTDRRTRERVLRVDMRIGDPSSDNSNFAGNFSTTEWYWNETTVDDDYLALRRELWLRTDDAYRGALERLAAKRAAAERQASSSDKAAPDFVAAKPVSIIAAPPPTPPAPALADLVVKLSGLFRDYAGIQDSRVTASHARTRRRFLSTEGTWIDDGSSQVYLRALANTQAADGMRLWNEASFRVATLAALPPPREMETSVRRMADELLAMREAPLPEASDAVVIFEGPAAGQICKRLLADQLSGTPPPRTARGDDRPEGSLASRLGQRVAPAFLSAHDDPLAERGPRGAALYGAYRADDEGQPAERVTVIDKGVLTNLLTSRTPSLEQPRSNGHARGGPIGAAFQGRIGNLFVSGGSAGLGARALRARAIAVAKESGPKTAVYVVRLLSENPLVAYRLENGHETPVRGLVLQGMTPRSLRDIVAVGDTPYVHNLLDAAISSRFGIPAAIITPALVFKDVEARRSREKPPKPPLYPHPFPFAAAAPVPHPPRP
jgi:TldD protein